jgi:hypothetical protein
LKGSKRYPSASSPDLAFLRRTTVIRKSVVHDDPPPIVLSRRAEIKFLLLPLAVVGLMACFLFRTSNCLDGCGPYHNTTSVADLDGDGDLDVVLNNLRHETDTMWMT